MSFDPNQFLEGTIDGANSTEYIPVPEGEFPAFVDKVDVKQWTKKDDSTISGLKLVVTWAIEDEEVKQLLERQKVTINQEIMLDLTESGSLDLGKGKNVRLGRLREAVGLNTPGRPFSFQMMMGQSAVIQVSHRTYNDQIMADVKDVRKQ